MTNAFSCYSLKQHKHRDTKRNASDDVIMDPKCKVAIITGGATGIGLAAACHLLKHGAKHVVINGPNRQEGEATEEGLASEFGEDKVTYCHGDVNDAEHFESLFEYCMEKFNGVDILFNNAGILHDKKWELTVDTNIKGVIRGTLLAFKYMGKDNHGKGGLVINCASIVGLQPLPGAPIYSISKYAVIGTVKNFGDKFHYDRTNIRVVAVCPGVTGTDLVHGAEDRQYTPEWGKHAYQQLQSLPAQSTDVLGQAVVYITKCAPSGSVWIVEDSKLYCAEIPSRHCYSKLIMPLQKN
ncbi:15-hydroxyprostaglandin dehydrogenase [NAD(+)]-like [Periplaneta americana]|uniref:15-hydroxyprostaglandin dehydrogenase [NAD(+)]-like n=1 Tax=Periplaneta americana TaxID=6978 RepID=UPI0037E997A7